MKNKIFEYNKAFKDGYNAALNIKSGHLTQIMLYGYTLEQILNMIEKEEMNKLNEEPKLMTREEAFKKCVNTMSGDPIRATDLNIRQFCNFIEALGLIKFKEEKKRFEFYNPTIDQIIHTNDIHEASNLILDGFVLFKDNGLVTKNG